MNFTDRLRDLAKRAGPIAIAKVIVEDDNAYGISEHELTSLVVECAKRDNPALSEAQAFARVFTDQSEAGVVLRKAFQVVKAGTHAADTADADAAMRELVAIGKSRWPSLTTAQQFARAFETNPDLAKRAHRRPSMLSEAMDVMLKIGITERRIRNPHCTQAAQQCRLWPRPRTAQRTEAYGPSVSL